MRIATHRPDLSPRVLPFAALLLTVVAAPCAAQTSAILPAPLRPSAERPTEVPQGSALDNAQPMVLFENLSTDNVTVYLVTHGARWPIGRVQPGQQTLLPLPITLADARTRHYTLVAVPLGARLYLGSPSAPAPIPIESEPLLGEHVAATRWRLIGTHLIGYPLPRARR